MVLLVIDTSPLGRALQDLHGTNSAAPPGHVLRKSAAFLRANLKPLIIFIFQGFRCADF